MSTTAKKFWTFLTPTFRLSFSNLIVPHAYVSESGKKGAPQFTVDMIFEEADMDKFRLENEKGGLDPVIVRDICKQIAGEKWPGQKLGDLFPNMKGWPILLGDKVAAKAEAKGKTSDHTKGKVVIKAKSSEERPPILTAMVSGKVIQYNRAKPDDLTAAKDLFYSGAYAQAAVNVRASTVDEKNYLTFYINDVLFKKHGEKLGKGSAFERWSGVEGGVANYDPTEGIGDDLGDDAEFDA